MTKENSLPLITARMYANIIKNLLSEYCERIEIAGSIRRQRPQVHDIDIVLIPKENCMEAIKAKCMAYHPFMDTSVPAPKWGDKMAVFSYNGKVQVDLYFADFRTWPILLFIKTGSKENNVKIMSLCKERDYYLAADGSGMWSDRLKQNRIPIECEGDIFGALDLQYLEPVDRED